MTHHLKNDISLLFWSPFSVRMLTRKDWPSIYGTRKKTLIFYLVTYLGVQMGSISLESAI